jgi:hypothetical protein
VNVKAIWETRGRLVFRAISALSVSARRESWIAGAATEVGLAAPTGETFAPLAVGGPLEPGPAGAPDPAPAPVPGLSPEPLAPFSSEAAGLPPPSAGGWKAAIPAGVPTPVGPS